MKSIECQFAIVGGGFSGTLLAMILKRLGYDVVVIERSCHPRFAMGESLTPLANQILRVLAERYDLEWLVPLTRYGEWQQTYPGVTGGIKRGFSYFFHRAGERFSATADHENELLVAASESDFLADTHWLRADVDALFARQATAMGVELYEHSELVSVERDASRGWRIEWSDPESGDVQLCHCSDWIVDASGAAGAAASRLGAKSVTGGFHTRTSSAFTHFTKTPRFEVCLDEIGVDRSDYPFRCDDAAVHHLVDGGWIWQIRFCDDRVSTGLVRNHLQESVAAELRTNKRHFDRCVARYPQLERLFSTAELSQVPGEWFETGILQRRRDRAGGDRWVCLPHTFAFIDPLHSTGIAWSLHGVSRLAACFENKADHDARAGLIEDYSNSLEHERRHLDQIVAAAYYAQSDMTLFHAAVMAYFAAATIAERKVGQWPRHGFLGSDQLDFQTALQQIFESVKGTDLADRADVLATVKTIRELLQPFDRVGLFSPAIPRLYSETAAPV